MVHYKSEFLNVITKRGFLHQCTDVDELDKRICIFKEWIEKKNETTFIVISHASFIGRFLFNDTSYPIEHTKIYEYEL